MRRKQPAAFSTKTPLKLEGKKKFNGIEFNHKVFSDGSGLDFAVSDLAYDGNGNILSMKQKRLITTISGTVDNLSYRTQVIFYQQYIKTESLQYILRREGQKRFQTTAS